jgi:peroxiredoxin
VRERIGIYFAAVFDSDFVSVEKRESMANLIQVLKDLPVPVDDGCADHLVGSRLPDTTLQATNGQLINPSQIAGTLVMYCYPMTGRPDVPLPEGWDQIPGARGCTPQSCAFRDHYQEIKELGADVFGLSTQPTEYQKEMVNRLHLPFQVLSDSNGVFTNALQLPTFVAANQTLLKRLTIISKDHVIQAVHYPVFPSEKDPEWVMDQLKRMVC